VGAFAPGTVGGRRAHPPKSWKVIALSMNIKERRKSIRSALAATVTTDEVGKKHRLPKNYPVVLDASFEALSRTSEVEQCLVKLGLQDELTRAIPNVEKFVRELRKLSAHDAEAERRALMRPGMGKVFKQILDRQSREAREAEEPREDRRDRSRRRG